jgi:sulfite reductase alpha subunit-like flavoprotein
LPPPQPKQANKYDDKETTNPKGRATTSYFHTSSTITSMPENGEQQPGGPRTERIYVLYGSQTGNSEQAAREICAALPTQLGAAVRALQAPGDPPIVCEALGPLPLDDFLEVPQGPARERCAWTRCTIIVTSSYGVGQAPLGCHRFRQLADAWFDEYGSREDDAATKTTDDTPLPLTGLSYALCGLGDSKFTTYFENPTRLDAALTRVGMTRLGPLGQADASQKVPTQTEVIAAWRDALWAPLAAQVVTPPLSNERLPAAQAATSALCARINPDFLPDPTGNHSNGSWPKWLIVLAVALLAVLLALRPWWLSSLTTAL